MPQLTHKFKIPLFNVELGKDIEEVTLGQYKIYRHIPYEIGPKKKNGIIYTINSNDLSFTGPNTLEKPRHEILRLLAILKLFKEGTPFSNVVILRNKSIDIVPHFQTWRHRSKYSFAKKYSISKTDIAKLQSFWSSYLSVPIDNFAVYHMITADHNPYDDGMLLQYIFALEHLFVPDGKEGNITYKLLSRGTYILGAKLDPPGKRELYERLKELYGCRSSIVHGRGKNDDDQKFKERLLRLLPIARGYCRAAIRYFHEQDQLNDHDNRRSHINDKVLFS